MLVFMNPEAVHAIEIDTILIKCKNENSDLCSSINKLIKKVGKPDYIIKTNRFNEIFTFYYKRKGELISHEFSEKGLIGGSSFSKAPDPHVVCAYNKRLYKPDIGYKNILNKSLKLIPEYFLHPNGVFVDTIFLDSTNFYKIIFTDAKSFRNVQSIFINGKSDFISVYTNDSDVPFEFTFNENEKFIGCMTNFWKPCKKINN